MRHENGPARRWCIVLVVAITACSAVGLSAMDFRRLATDDAMDRWLQEKSPTYAGLIQEIKARKDLRGYRFAGKDDVRRGLVLWTEGYLEIRLNSQLTGADRMTTLIFEVANASRHRDHQQIDRAADAGLIGTAEEFGLGHEMIEYEALRIHRHVLLELESRAGPLPQDFFYYVTPPPHATKDYRLPDLYAYLKTQKESGHTGHYYRLYAERKAKR